MSAKGKSSRFSYLPPSPSSSEAAPAPMDVPAEGAAARPDPGALESVPRGAGRMAQEREQLNVRLPTMLKRRAMAKAALEGRAVGDVIEELLRHYVDDQ